MPQITQQYPRRNTLPHNEIVGEAQHDSFIEGEEHVGSGQLVVDYLVAGSVFGDGGWGHDEEELGWVEPAEDGAPEGEEGLVVEKEEAVEEWDVRVVNGHADGDEGRAREGM